MTDLLIQMEAPGNSNTLIRNTLFATLGAICAAIVSLGVFTSAQTRAPASRQVATELSNFEPLIYLPDLS